MIQDFYHFTGLYASKLITIFIMLGLDEQDLSVTVKDLLKGLYDKACQQKLWGLVRHTAGMKAL